MRASTLCAVLMAASWLSACVSETPKQEPWETPERVDVQVDLAWNYLRIEDLAAAREHVDNALELDSRDARANHVKALLLLRLREPDAARSYFERAVRSDPNYNDARNDFGRYLCQRGDYDEGIKELERALDSALNRRVTVSNVYLGDCYFAQGNREYASRYYSQALALNPKLARPLFAMALIRFEEASYLSARAFLERYFEVGPDSAPSLLFGVKVERALGADDSAREYARTLRSKYPRSREMAEAAELIPGIAQ